MSNIFVLQATAAVDDYQVQGAVPYIIYELLITRCYETLGTRVQS